jgi:uncharacterized membrane protein YtjA (UPF0391 family)
MLCVEMPFGKTAGRGYPIRVKGIAMLHWALIFLVIAIIAAVFGFGGVYVAAAGIAKILFFIFVVLFIVSLLGGGLRRGPPIP